MLGPAGWPAPLQLPPRAPCAAGRAPRTELGGAQQLGADGLVGEQRRKVPQLEREVQRGIGDPNVDVLPAVPPGGGGRGSTRGAGKI